MEESLWPPLPVLEGGLQVTSTPTQAVWWQPSLVGKTRGGLGPTPKRWAEQGSTGILCSGLCHPQERVPQVPLPTACPAEGTSAPARLPR